MKQYDRIILGIDPGTNILGFGLLGVVSRKPTYISMGIMDLHKLKDPYLKLKEIFSETVLLIDKYKPDELAIEAPFYGKNVQSMLKLGRAQGVAMAAALSRSVPIFEYAPRKIKLAITGQGGASKEQVAAMLSQILHYDEIQKSFDATDGLAAALCHFYQANQSTAKVSYNNWGDFIKKNPTRLK